jgi:hypothetical protein
LDKKKGKSVNLNLIEFVVRRVTPLTDLQARILELLGLSIETYTRLADN